MFLKTTMEHLAALDPRLSCSIDDPVSVFQALSLACQSRDLAQFALDSISKLYPFFKNIKPSLVVDTICSTFSGPDTPPAIQLQIIKALCSAITSDFAHSSDLLKAVRVLYNIFLLSSSDNLQSVSQASLANCALTVFGRIPNPPTEFTDDPLFEFNHNTEIPTNLSDLEIDSNEILSDEVEFTSKERSYYSTCCIDAYLLLRAFCKLSMTSITTNEGFSSLI